MNVPIYTWNINLVSMLFTFGWFKYKSVVQLSTLRLPSLFSKWKSWSYLSELFPIQRLIEKITVILNATVRINPLITETSATKIVIIVIAIAIDMTLTTLIAIVAVGPMAIIIVQVQFHGLTGDEVQSSTDRKRVICQKIVETRIRNVRWIRISIMLWKINEKISWWTWTWIWMSRWTVLGILWCIMDQVSVNQILGLYVFGKKHEF